MNYHELPPRTDADDRAFREYREHLITLAEGLRALSERPAAKLPRTFTFGDFRDALSDAFFAGRQSATEVAGRCSQSLAGRDAQ